MLNIASFVINYNLILTNNLYTAIIVKMTILL